MPLSDGVVGTLRAFVRLRLPNGEVAELGHGDIIGRLATASLPIDDPRVSSAHALVSLRRGELMLLSLRRMFAVRGKPVSEAVLRPGMAIELAEGISLYVEHVQRPAAVLAIEIVGLGRRTLPGLASVHAGPPPHLATRFEPDAALHVWWNGDAWHARAGSSAVRTVGDGDVITAAGLEARFVMVEVEGSATTPNGGDVEAPLRIVAWYDSVEIHRDGRAPLTLGGTGARILSGFSVLAGPVEWHVVAKEIWRDAADAHDLRHRWDVTLARLRTRLRTAGVRRDLLRSDGSGLVQLIRYPADVVEDRT